MDQNKTEKLKKESLISKIVHSFIPVLRSKFFYIGLLVLAAGAALNFASQTYLHNYMSEGKTLPMLSDLILDNLPVINRLLFMIFFVW
jgi:hypothetical protein